ncbi:MAG: amidohydrolase family protein [Planctomycetaceae bacterium]|nr:amidohydrolase family protein [Planctomycetaceae bacterium]
MNRREILRRAATALTVSVVGSNGVTQSPAKLRATSVIVDTHLHCFAGNDPAFPYHAQAPYRPDTAATPEHLLQCMNAAGVDYAIVVHPEPYQDDHQYLHHCLQVGAKRLKGTCLFFADRPGATQQMTRLVRQLPGQIVAARIHAYAPDRLPPFGQPELRELWKSAADLGLAVQLHFEPRYAAGFEPFIREFADTTVIIDHLGRPMQGTVEEHARVVGWARFPNTIMKVSSLPDQNRYPHRDVRPVIRQLTNAYGADRMIYGGGFEAAATGESYRAYREHVVELLSHLATEEQEKILGMNAARLFRFPAPANVN